MRDTFVKTLLELAKQDGISLGGRLEDCGTLVFDREKQDVHAGGSGCGCAASVFNGYILNGMREGRWNRVLFVPTGALMSTVSYNEGMTVPGIAHGVVLEHC